jgi:hypothetical protein
MFVTAVVLIFLKERQKMKRVLVAAIALFFSIGCSAHNQAIIDGVAKDMKFKVKEGVSIENQAEIDKKCREQIEEPYYKTGVWLGAVGYKLKMQDAYQDCMARGGFDCIKGCAYDAK